MICGAVSSISRLLHTKKIPPQQRSGISYTKLHRFQTKLIHVQIYYSTERRKCEDNKDH